MVPAATPVTKPVVPTVAVVVLVLLHTPPPATSDSVMDAVGQTDEAPLTEPADGVVLTVTITEAYTGPQELLTA